MPPSARSRFLLFHSVALAIPRLLEKPEAAPGKTQGSRPQAAAVYSLELAQRPAG